MTDCYIASGNGPGISYHRGGFFVRIDNIMAGIEKLPESWNEFLQVCGQIEDWSLKNGKEIRPLQVSAEGYLYLVDHMFIDAGRKEADIKKWENIGEEDFVSILDTLKTIYRYSFPDNKNYSYRDEKELFNEGKLATVSYTHLRKIGRN